VSLRDWAALPSYSCRWGRVAAQTATRRMLSQQPTTRQEGVRQQATVELATFAVGENWYATARSPPHRGGGYALHCSRCPKTESWCAGYLMFAGEPIVVADLARVLGTTNIETARTVIAIRAPGHARPFGLLVEALGDIPEVARAIAS